MEVHEYAELYQESKSHNAKRNHSVLPYNFSLTIKSFKQLSCNVAVF